MYRSFLNTLILGSLFFSFFTIAGNNVQGGVIHFRGEIVEPACELSAMHVTVKITCMQNGVVHTQSYSGKELMSGKVKNAQIASVKMQYIDEQKKLAVMNIEYH
ncbi:type 1 fimbrial protein [Escherichia albertii]|uniref:type 1 fimbrial protein n=1 Tax=Escherichia albertii TaxID=208962 RepID=UPI001F414E3A|nr:type 1 fimbrial protein [Escherichia albertii]EEU9597763.1 type 1 fimbrial protein [Escherichia albertii]MCE7719435.1 type 1 fimbrial protein [Escherichia albertii]MCE7724118.1 type 1 fimbrial protein [Escherichia albertii]QTA06232.1 type 1 fimbrial protein [Escherichia albertii]